MRIGRDRKHELLFWRRVNCLPSMNFLGIDYGEKRWGLSYGDDSIGVAVPIAAAIDATVEERWNFLGNVVKERRIQHFVVGFPFNMDGSIGFKAKEVQAFIDELEKRFSLPIEKVDERLTSHQVERQLQAMGGKRKNAKEQKAYRKSGDVDSRAASLILQDYFDSKTNRECDLLD